MTYNRRQFINLSVLSCTGLLIGISYGCKKAKTYRPQGRQHRFNPFLELKDDGSVIIYAPVPELGQGIRTSLAMIVAEELDADWAHILVKQAEADKKYGNMSAAGSTSVSRFYQPLREAGALARQMLLAAAAVTSGGSASDFRTSNSTIINKASGRSYTYAEMVITASNVKIPDKPALKDEDSFTLLGKSKSGVDLMDIVTGRAVYGCDAVMEGMKYVAIERCPVRGGRLISYEASAALEVPGVLQVIEIQGSAPISYAEVLPGVAVIAETTFAALRGKQLLKIIWDYGPARYENSQNYWDSYKQLKNEPWETTLRQTEQFPEAEGASDTLLEFDYKVPFWAHFCMEPMNFTAHFKGDSCELIGPNQAPQLIQTLVAQYYNIPRENVLVYSTLSGGGFGRRLAVDYALEAAMVSKQSGFPVKVIWTREDDTLHDYFRTLSFQHLKVGLKYKSLHTWYHHIMTKPIGDGARYEVQGAADIPFLIPHYAIGYSKFPTGIKIGSWRSVSHSFNSFVVNNTITEIAEYLNKDALEFYLELMGDQAEVDIQLPLEGSRGRVHCDVGRLRNVLIKAGELSGWPGRKNDPQRAQGIACTFFKTSYAAHVVEVSKVNNRIRIDKITAVLDCGRVLNPSGVKAQMEGAISDAITVTLKSNITIEHGRANELNFDSYKVTRIMDMPELHLHIMESQEESGGAGEPPFPSVPPAIAHAVHQLTGIKVRKLPIDI